MAVGMAIYGSAPGYIVVELIGFIMGTQYRDQVFISKAIELFVSAHDPMTTKQLASIFRTQAIYTMGCWRTKTDSTQPIIRPVACFRGREYVSRPVSVAHFQGSSLNLPPTSLQQRGSCDKHLVCRSKLVCTH